MKVLVTGGAGFIGRWVVKHLLEDGRQVWVLDNLSNGDERNLFEFANHPGLRDVVVGDVTDAAPLDRLFEVVCFDACFHLAANINVQESIDDPRRTFQGDVVGTLAVLEAARRRTTKVVFVSSCMVYDAAKGEADIAEESPVVPRSPYAASKAAAEHLVRSYYHAYGLPMVILRPFNTYGPFQKSTAEGGVIAIFLRNALAGLPVRIYGDGMQTRDFLYVEDCARFVVAAGYAEQAIGEVLNAGTGSDVSINALARLIAGEGPPPVYVPHIHPQCEIVRLRCNSQKAKRLLAWEPAVGLADGIAKTRQWILAQ